MASVDERRAQVFRLRAEGASYRQIERVTGVNRGTASRWVSGGFTAWQAAHRAARDERPVEAPAAVGPEVEDFLKVLRGTGRVSVAAASVGADAETVQRWLRAHRGEVERARATLVLHTTRILHSIAGNADAAHRDRIAAADRLLQYATMDAPVEGEPDAGPPPVPIFQPQGPSDVRCGGCPPGLCRQGCAAGRWMAWVERVCWARAKPGATDAVALQAAGSLVSPADVADWLEQGRAQLESGDLDAPAAQFAMRWAHAAATSVGGALEAHEAALLSGRAAATQAALATLAAVAPEEYGGRGDPRRLGASGEAEPPVARLLRLSYADDDEDDDL